MAGKGTKRRTIRIDDDLWEDAKREAADRGEDLSEPIRKFLERYVQRRD